MSAQSWAPGVDASAMPVMSRHRVLIVHNAYQQRGGEDAVVDAEVELLRQRGHAVELFQRHNDELRAMPAAQAVVDTIWSRRSVAALSESIQCFKPDVVHFHNTFPLVSPSAYWAVRSAGLPVVQTLHNFRLHCPQAMYLREGRVCEDCLGHASLAQRIARLLSRLPRAVCRPDRDAGGASGAGTYRHKVTRYIALNEFCRRKFIEGGLPADRIVVKPNFVDFAAPVSAERQRLSLCRPTVGRKRPGRIGAGHGSCWRRGRYGLPGQGRKRTCWTGMPASRYWARFASDAVREQMIKRRRWSCRASGMKLSDPGGDRGLCLRLAGDRQQDRCAA